LSNHRRWSNPPKENAAAADSRNGADDLAKRDISPAHNSLKHRFDAMLNWGDPDHVRAMRVAGHALTLGTSDAWLNASAVWAARLSVPERVALAYAALKALDEDDAYLTASTAIFGTLYGEAVQ
tara:strand:- start:287 stop:658 length:372 start_codon:yes stop_codon:yes gene_type:complete